MFTLNFSHMNEKLSFQMFVLIKKEMNMADLMWKISLMSSNISS